MTAGEEGEEGSQVAHFRHDDSLVCQRQVYIHLKHGHQRRGESGGSGELMVNRGRNDCRTVRVGESRSDVCLSGLETGRELSTFHSVILLLPLLHRRVPSLSCPVTQEPAFHSDVLASYFLLPFLPDCSLEPPFCAQQSPWTKCK